MTLILYNGICKKQKKYFLLYLYCVSFHPNEASLTYNINQFSKMAATFEQLDWFWIVLDLEC